MVLLKKYMTTLAAFSVSAALLAQPAIVLRPKERLLVLGFDSRQLNDVQDRLLRETIMRRLRMNGFAIVPVMEVESLFYEGRRRQIRKLKRNEIRSLCDELRAGFACCGKIVPENGRADKVIDTGKNYICTLLLYRKDKNAFNESTLKIAGGESLYQFFESLSEMIVNETVKML